MIICSRTPCSGAGAGPDTVKVQVNRSTRPTDGDGVPSTVRTATLSTGRPNSAEASSDLIRSSHVSGSGFPASRVGGAPADVVGAASKVGTATTTGPDEQALTPATTAAPHTARVSHAGPARRPCRTPTRGSPPRRRSAGLLPRVHVRRSTFAITCPLPVHAPTSTGGEPSRPVPTPCPGASPAGTSRRAHGRMRPPNLMCYSLCPGPASGPFAEQAPPDRPPRKFTRTCRAPHAPMRQPGYGW